MTTAEELQRKADEKISAMLEAMDPNLRVDAPFIMMLLTEPEGEDIDQETLDRYDRTCDLCGTYCPDNELFYTGSIERQIPGATVMVTFGVCKSCRDS
jgi:hypothetical protein